MKSKPAQKTAKTAAQNATKKVFDVTRPGKTPVSPTSRPVIVGHKPQVKDPMMSDRDEDRPLLDSSKKVTIQPGADASAASASVLPPTDASPAAPVLPPTDSDSAISPLANPSLEQVGSRTAADDKIRTESEAEKPAEPSAADSVATIATSSVVDDVPPPQEDTAESTKPTEPVANGNTTSGLVFDDLDGANPDLTKPVANGSGSSSLPPTDSDSGRLPSANPSLEQVGSRTEQESTDEGAKSEPAVVGQAVVSHHKQSGGAGKVLVALFILLILVIIAFDILLDLGILNMSNIPHTSFFSSN